MEVREYPSIKVSCFANPVELHDSIALSKEDIEKQIKFM